MKRGLDVGTALLSTLLARLGPLMKFGRVPVVVVHCVSVTAILYLSFRRGEVHEVWECFLESGLGLGISLVFARGWGLGRLLREDSVWARAIYFIELSPGRRVVEFVVWRNVWLQHLGCIYT